MPYYRSVGEVPPKRHTQHRGLDGGLYYEELMGEEGFSSDSSLLYHRAIPSAVTDATLWDLADLSTLPNHPLKPRHLRLHTLFSGEDWRERDAVAGRRLVLGNTDVRISYAVAGTPSPLYRNALGDECVYIESGEAVVETVFGALPAREGDYVLLRRATTHRWVPRGDAPCVSTASRPTVTSHPPTATCRSSGSCWSTLRSASVTCTARPRPWRPPARTSRCW